MVLLLTNGRAMELTFHVQFLATARGGYAGVTPSAELYFQAMENDNTGNFQSPSLTQLLNNAYNAGARTHTNSWGISVAVLASIIQRAKMSMTEQIPLTVIIAEEKD